MKCFGLDPSSGAYLEIDYDSVITGVDTLINVPKDPLYVAPAWIDLQVNGYAAVDYNSPDTSHRRDCPIGRRSEFDRHGAVLPDRDYRLA